MKNLYSCLIILILLVSCTDDNQAVKNGIDQGMVQGQHSATPVNKSGDILPENNDNPYDAAGRIHNELATAYYASEALPNTVPGVIAKVESIANASSNFNRIKGTGSHPISASRIACILNHKSTCITEIINGTNMASTTKSSLISFINSSILLFEKGSTAEALYAYVAAYELTIINDPVISATDKQIALITTSVARHSMYRARKRPKRNTDPDWALMVGNIIAATDTADNGPAEALTTALATGVIENQ